MDFKVIWSDEAITDLRGICSKRFGTSGLLWIGAPAIELAVMFVSHVAHATRPECQSGSALKV
jgi:hypothetical protein